MGINDKSNFFKIIYKKSKLKKNRTLKILINQVKMCLLWIFMKL